MISQKRVKYKKSEILMIFITSHINKHLTIITTAAHNYKQIDFIQIIRYNFFIIQATVIKEQTMKNERIPFIGFSVTAMILGIISCVTAIASVLFFQSGAIFSLLIGVTGLVFAVISIKKASSAKIKNKTAVIALILSIAGIITAVIGIILWIMILNNNNSVNSMNDLNRELDELYKLATEFE